MTSQAPVSGTDGKSSTMEPIKHVRITFALLVIFTISVRVPINGQLIRGTLLDQLFTNHNILIRPAYNATTATNITQTIIVYQITDTVSVLKNK
jgi:hypothetical protein